MTGVLRLTAATLLAGGLLVPMGTAPATAEDCPPDARILDVSEVAEGTSVTECNLVGQTVASGDAALDIPTPGNGVSLIELTPDGTAEVQLLVVVGDDSELHYTEGDASTGPDTESAAECDDDTYRLFYSGSGSYGMHWEGPLNWGLNKGTIPGYLDQANAVNAIQAAGQNITHADNNCNLVDNISAVLDYQGDTNQMPQVGIQTVNGTEYTHCGDSGNGATTIGFDYRPDGIFATTCKHWSVQPGLDLIYEADIEISNRNGQVDWTTFGASDTCSPNQDQYDLEDIVTHEWGHAFGIEHAPFGHRALTMSPSVSPCNTTNRSLGLGDILGLRQLY